MDHPTLLFLKWNSTRGYSYGVLPSNKKTMGTVCQARTRDSWENGMWGAEFDFEFLGYFATRTEAVDAVEAKARETHVAQD